MLYWAACGPVRVRAPSRDQALPFPAHSSAGYCVQAPQSAVQRGHKIMESEDEFK